MVNKFLVVLIIGIVLRVLIAMSTYHSDLRTFQYAGQVFSEGHVFDLYDYIIKLPESEEIKKLVVFNYPPAIYWYHGIFNFIFSVIFGKELVNGFLINVEDAFGNFWFNIHLFLIKFPYLIFDILTAIYLSKLFSETKKRFLAFSFWMLNPIALYATYMISQFDIISVFFSVLALYFVREKKLPLAAFALGIGAAFKIYPIFLLLPLVLLNKTFNGKLQLILLGVAPYLFSILPYIFSTGFRYTALVASQTNKSFIAQIPISGGESLILFILAMVFVYLAFFYSKIADFSQNNFELVSRRFLMVLLLFFIFTHFHPQWIIWITPFLIVDLILNNFKNLSLVLIMFTTYLLSLFFFEPSLTIWMFAPIFPFLNGLPSIWKMMGLSIDYNFIRSVLQTVFSAAAFFYIFIYFPKIRNEQD